MKPGDTELQKLSAEPTAEQAGLVKMSTSAAPVTVAAAPGVVVAETAAGPLPASTSPTAEQKPSKLTKFEYADSGRAVAAY